MKNILKNLCHKNKRPGIAVAIEPALQAPRQGDRLAAINLAELMAHRRSPRSRLQPVSGSLSEPRPHVRQTPRALTGLKDTGSV